MYDKYGLRQHDDTHLVFVNLGISVADFRKNNLMLHTINKFFFLLVRNDYKGIMLQ